MWFLAIIIIFVVIFIIIIILVSTDKDNSGSNYIEQVRQNRKEYQKSKKIEFGNKGEISVARMLADISSEYYAFVFNDYTFKDDMGYSTNIDHILVCNGGLFIIETKANKGIIFGDDEREMWKALKEYWQEDKEFKNPIIQNKGHINHLKRMFKNNPPKMYSMIIFPFADKLDNIKSDKVFNVKDAYQFIINKIKEAKYTNHFVDSINIQLKDIYGKYGISLEEHIVNISNKLQTILKFFLIYLLNINE